MQSRRASWLGGKWDKKTCRYLICIGRPGRQHPFISYKKKNDEYLFFEKNAHEEYDDVLPFPRLTL